MDVIADFAVVVIFRVVGDGLAIIVILGVVFPRTPTIR
jgi:hypothetical protein